MMEELPHEGPWCYEQITLGYNYRITDFQAALIVSQMNKLDRFVTVSYTHLDVYKRQVMRFGRLHMENGKKTGRKNGFWQ